MGGVLQGKSFPIEAGGLRVGRTSGQNQLVIHDPEVSRQHAQIELADGAAKLVDRGSPNGTFVNSRRVREAVLKPGDVIRFGLQEVNRFVYQAAASPVMAAAVAAGSATPAAPANGRSEGPGTVVIRADEEPKGRRLQLVLDQYAVDDIELSGPRLEFGSTPGPHKLRIEHPSIAPRHAELINAKDSATLRDLGSAQGTRVNGEKIGERVLKEGDLLQFGSCETHVSTSRQRGSTGNAVVAGNTSAGNAESGSIANRTAANAKKAVSYAAACRDRRRCEPGALDPAASPDRAGARCPQDRLPQAP